MAKTIEAGPSNTSQESVIFEVGRNLGRAKPLTMDQRRRLAELDTLIKKTVPPDPKAPLVTDWDRSQTRDLDPSFDIYSPKRW